MESIMESIIQKGNIQEGDMVELPSGNICIVFECLDGAIKAYPINVMDKPQIASFLDCKLVKKRYDIDPEY